MARFGSAKTGTSDAITVESTVTPVYVESDIKLRQAGS
jgi:LysR family transcriptional regulator, glycine cleavage system transcriptional activator